MRLKQLFVASLFLLVALVISLALTGNQVAAQQHSLFVLEVEGMGTYNSNAPVQTSSGTAQGDHIGNVTYSTTWNAGGNIGPSGTGGNCIDGGGTVILTSSNGDTLSLEYSSKECDTGSVIGHFAVNGGYTITGGTGRFAGAFLHINGNIL